MKLSKITDYLICPSCKETGLTVIGKALKCKKCKSSYPVIDGVPVLLVEESFNKQESNQKVWFEKHYSQFSKHEYNLENWRKSMLERIFKGAEGKKIKLYLDIGCGATGYTAIEAAKKNNWISFGADISIEAMVKARKLADQQGVENKTAFVVCSAENLPFRKNSFDFVSAISLLEHLENDKITIAAISQILKKKGLAYICVPNTYKEMWLFLWPIYFYFDKQIGHKRHYAIEGLNRLMGGNGFHLKKYFYNAHLQKLAVLLLSKLNIISDEKWWEIERADFNQNNKGIQLNAIYEKK